MQIGAGGRETQIPEKYKWNLNRYCAIEKLVPSYYHGTIIKFVL